MTNRPVKPSQREKVSPLARVTLTALAGSVAIGLIFPGAPPLINAQVLTAAPKFEAASIKPCTAASLPGNARGAGAGKISWSPGRLAAECQTLENLVREAYLRYGDGKPTPLLMPGRRVPSVSDRLLGQPITVAGAGWINSDRYTIEASLTDTATEEITRGPMLQALLEERFRLKLHREAREVPVYNLTVAAGGPKLQTAQAAGCISVDPGNPRPRPALPQPTPSPSTMPCGLFIPDIRNDRIDMNGTTIANFSRSLSALFDRDVVDKTGLTGLFDIHLEVHQESRSAGPATGPGEPAPDRSAMLIELHAAIPKLGLRLESAKGSGEFIVIDHVERPSEN